MVSTVSHYRLTFSYRAHIDVMKVVKEYNVNKHSEFDNNRAINEINLLKTTMHSRDVQRIADNIHGLLYTQSDK